MPNTSHNVTVTETERWFISMALANFITETEDVPEVDLGDLAELHSKFLMPSDIC